MFNVSVAVCLGDMKGENGVKARVFKFGELNMTPIPSKIKSMVS